MSSICTGTLTVGADISESCDSDSKLKIVANHLLSCKNELFCDTWNTLRLRICRYPVWYLWNHSSGTACCLRHADLSFRLLRDIHLFWKATAWLSVVTLYFTGFFPMGICNTSLPAGSCAITSFTASWNVTGQEFLLDMSWTQPKNKTIALLSFNSSFVNHMEQLVSSISVRSQRWTALAAEQQNGDGISLRSSNVSADRNFLRLFCWFRTFRKCFKLLLLSAHHSYLACFQNRH